MILSLIGYRGTGKTTVARHLALRLGWDWVDADVEIELRAGKSIRAIFEDDGEPAFRDLETTIITELAGRDRLVVAAGGGAILRPQNRQALAAGGPRVWLAASPATIQARIEADETTRQRRPSLIGGTTLVEEIERLLAVRLPLYRESASLEIDTEGKTPAEIAAEIAQRLQLTAPPESP